MSSKPLVKTCAHCKRKFEKPKNCSLREWKTRRKYCGNKCRYEGSLKGKPSWSSGKILWSVRAKNAVKREIAPCRVCSGPTRFAISRIPGRDATRICEQESCREAARLKKNEKIREARLQEWSSGERARPAKSGVYGPRISKGETLLTDWFRSKGWVPQFHVYTGLNNRIGLPSSFDLDFAHPKKMLYVEVDGAGHKTDRRKKLDIRRDAILHNMGWTGFRITEDLARNNVKQAKSQVLEFVQAVS